jgi:hypothetical protein
MNTGMNIRRLIVWLLLPVFVLPYAAKTVHTCQCVHTHTVEREESGNHTQHDCNTCAICQFILSPFIETESGIFNCTTDTVYSEPVDFREKIHHPVRYCYHLRAPPCA